MPYGKFSPFDAPRPASYEGVGLTVVAFLAMSLLPKVACNKEDAYNKYREGNHHDDANTHANRVVYAVVVLVDHGAYRNGSKGKDDAANQLPPPCDDEEDYQKERWREVDKEVGKLHQNDVVGREGIECKYAYEDNVQNADDSWNPVKIRDGIFHSIQLFSATVG